MYFIGEGPCAFCDIIAGRAPAHFEAKWDDAIAIRPINPVTFGHTLVIPICHVASYTENPGVSAAVMRRAAELAPRLIGRCSNLITSEGAAATQTIRHLHLHIVPRSEGDGLMLPWSSGNEQAKEGSYRRPLGSPSGV